jgi:hypothetical protein
MRYLIALLGLALAMPHPAVAQAYDWRPVNHDTATMLQAGQYDAALPIIEAALAECPHAATEVEAGLCTAIFSENLANVREHQGDLTGAEAAFRKTLAVRASVLPANDPLIGQAHFFLALFFERQGRRADEVVSLQAAEAVARMGGPSHRAELAALLSRHAMALAALGKPAEALSLYQEAHTTAEAVGGPASRGALITLGNLFTGQISAGFPGAAIDAVSAVLASPDVGRSTRHSEPGLPANLPWKPPPRRGPRRPSRSPRRRCQISTMGWSPIRMPVSPCCGVRPASTPGWAMPAERWNLPAGHGAWRRINGARPVSRSPVRCAPRRRRTPPATTSQTPSRG